MVCEGCGSCRYILGIPLMVHSQSKEAPDFSYRQRLKLPMNKRGAWGPVANQNEAQYSQPMIPASDLSTNGRNFNFFKSKEERKTYVLETSRLIRGL